MSQFLYRKEIKIERNHTGLIITGLVVVFFAVVFLFIWQKFALARQLADLENDQNYLQAILSRQKALTMELQQAGSRSRLEELASGQLGFVYPGNQQVVVMLQPPSERSGSLGAALAGLFKPVSSAWSKP
jgi:hypothetical protein